MKLLLSTLLLTWICDLSPWSVSSAGAISVTQSPDVSVMEGEAVNITCCWTGTSGKVLVNWLKHQSKIEFIQKNETQGHCSNLIFTNITREDSERYICKVTVDIPVLAEGIGNGTVITVLRGAGSDENTDDTVKTKTSGSSSRTNLLIFMLRCLPILALLMTTLYFNNIWPKTHLAKPAAPGRSREEMGRKPMESETGNENRREKRSGIRIFP